MASHATEKLTTALSQLVEAYTELQEEVSEKLNSEDTGYEADDDNNNETDEKSTDKIMSEIDTAMVSELKLAIDSVIDSDDVSTEEFATIITTVVDALEELDPNCFSVENEELEEEEEDDDEKFDEDDDDVDIDDYDYDEDDDDDDYEEDEEEDDDDDDYPKKKGSKGKKKK